MVSRPSFRRGWQSLPRWMRRVIVATVGAVLFAVGAVFTVLPGPGIPFLVASLAVLAAEFAWAEHRLRQLRDRSANLRERFTRRRAGEAIDTEEAAPWVGPGDEEPENRPESETR